MYPVWLEYQREMGGWSDTTMSLGAEYKQAFEEGKDVEALKPVFDAVIALESSDSKKRLANDLYDIVQELPIREGYPYVEPSDLEGIKAARPANRPVLPAIPDDKKLLDRFRGAWYGRVCGCLLGKPIEGWRAHQIIDYAKATGNWPINYYLKTDAEAAARVGQSPNRCFIDTVKDASPSDDDTNYTVTALKLIEAKGKEFTPSDMAFAWFKNATVFAYCTAERTAYINLLAGIKPPYSATHRSPYREFIGAQIRADYFGYICPGNPELAAELAWRDACISHVKNGIYGEMFVAAMLAAAAVTDDLRLVIEAGLGEIPANCRLAEDIKDVLKSYVEGKIFDVALNAKYSENKDWCLTQANAMIVVAALLWGEFDFANTIHLSVVTGFDTDCNGATAGSILGMLKGDAIVPQEWKAPICGKLRTSIAGYELVEIDKMAEITLRHSKL
ncbi:MAG: ADP-ribosylglycohydrolase family protein [Clostridiales bacterium]|nr:ADP-ribosylglycohydrolase family protein [Clostridiales bacterium]